MNYTQSFEEFSTSLGPTDLALYAGIGVVLYVLFKDKLSPVQKMVMDLVDLVLDLKESFNNPKPATTPVQAVSPKLESAPGSTNFVNLIASWKQTRDLAVKAGCYEAVKSLDDVYGLLSPKTCPSCDGTCPKEKVNE